MGLVFLTLFALSLKMRFRRLLLISLYKESFMTAQDLIPSCSAKLAHSSHTKLIALGCLMQISPGIALYRQAPEIRRTCDVDDAAGG
jgi:hypothetical protein